MVQIDDSLLVAKLCPPGSGCTYTWTLVSQFGSMISEVEELFGTRNHNYTILGVEFSGTIPHIWFPLDIRYPHQCKRIAIQLGEPAMMDANLARFQLAHETVHLLDPVEAANASVLEEGLATYYQLMYFRRIVPNCSTVDAKYNAARELAAKLMAESPKAIKKLRAQGQTISTLTAQQLREECMGLTNEEATILARPFRDWSGNV